MIDPVFQSANYMIARKLLDSTALRQQAIASNIANADTPGYRRVELAPDFAAQLRNSLASGKPASIASVQPKLVEDANARSVRPDGNTVEIERELLEMNRNTVEYNYLTEIVSRNIKHMRMAISGRAM